jgi:integrase
MGTLVRVKGIRRWRHPKTGIWYCYHRKSGTPIRAEFGSPTFFAELAAIEKRQESKTAKPGTLGLAIDAYHRTPAWAALRPKTRVSYERAIAILEPLRDMPLISLNRSTIIRLRDEKIFPRHGRWMANYVVTFLGILLPFCRDYDFIKDNPLAERVKKIRKPQGTPVQNRPWTEDECRIVLEKAPPHLRVPIALAMCAGLRKADVLTVTKAAIVGGMITVTTAKREKEISAPVHPLLADAIKTLPASDAVQIAVNSYGQPWSETGFNSSWSKFRNSLQWQGLVGKGLTIHGLRHTLGTRLKEAGADDGMIADILGNTIPRHYSSGAKLSQKAKGLVVNLSLDGNKSRPKVSTPD